MSATIACNPCCSTETTTQLPGPPGTGTPGTNGQNAFTALVSATFQLTSFGAVTITVGNNAWAAVGENIFVSDQNTKWGTLKVTAIPAGSTQITGIWQNLAGEQTSGTITTGIVTPTGAAFVPGALPTAFTDNSGGAASNTIAAGVGVTTVALFCNLADLANHDLLTAYVPGYAFKILVITFAVEKAVTTGSKLATLTPAINGTPLSGGVLSLTSANCSPQGALVAASNVTGSNTGANTASISITGSSVTTFIEGSGWIILQIQNMDTANAFASLASHVNTLISAL